MTTTPAFRDARIPFLFAVSIATILAVWLRTYGITGQVVLDDEWHAIHKLRDSGWGAILKTFGMADHSIPLTVLYKAMAETVGLAEGRMRALQIACGIALVPAAAWLAWRATRDAPAAALFAFLLAGAPFLVMWSRFARPYAITLFLTLICVAALWRWRTHRTRKLAALAAVTASLAAWFHPIAGVYAVIGCLFIFFEDVAAPRGVRPRPSTQSLVLGIVVAVAMAVPLVPPLSHDFASLAAKAGGDQPTLNTYGWMLAVFWGGVPTPVIALCCAFAAWGVVVLLRRDTRLALYLLLMGLLPGAMVTLTGAWGVHSGQNFGRYVLPLQPILLFSGSLGVISLVRALARRRAEAAAWTAAATLSVAYLYATPAIAQVATLGPWYAHLGHHWDYRYRWMAAARHDPAYAPPEFYLKLGRMAPGSAPIIEAPFTYEAPYNALAVYATFHQQPETLGMIHDLCLEGSRRGEPTPRDPRFRFGKFVFLDDPESVKRTGARYLLLLRETLHGRPFVENERCLAKLTALYGAPLQVDARLAVFDLKPGEPEPPSQ